MRRLGVIWILLSFLLFILSVKTLSPGRLPQDLQPQHYRITLLPNIGGNFTTFGTVSILLKCLKITNKVVFHMKDITIMKLELKQQDNVLHLKSESYDGGREMYYGEFSENMEEGKSYKLYIEFTSVLNDLLQGFYRCSYKTEDNSTRWMAVTQFSPTDARRAFPCWDEPSRKARFTITIGRDESYHSLSNMPHAFSVPMNNKAGWYWDHYKTTLPMSTYLVVFIVSDLDYITVPSDKLTFKVWARKEAIAQTQYAANIAPALLTKLEEYFGLEFPLPKLDMAAIPDFGFSGMENWGLITYRESAMLVDPARRQVDSHFNVGTVVSHEIGHQWFGNLVTPAWWDQLWLKEGFATYIGYLALDQVEPSWQVLDLFVRNTVQRVLQRDSLLSSHKISNPVEDSNDIRQMFDIISYRKGASLIRMIHHLLGENKFRNGLKNYLWKHKYGNTKQEDVWWALGESGGGLAVKELGSKWLQTIMDSWTLQTGYPLLTVTRDYTNSSFIVKQDRFLLNGKDDSAARWWVPVTYTYNSKLNSTSGRMLLLSPDQEKLEVRNIPNSEWLLLNINQSGFYRVNYDMNNWWMLEKDFILLNDITRSQLIDDAFQLAQLGLIPYQLLFKMMKQIKSVQSYLSWSTTLTHLTHMAYIFRGLEEYSTFRRFVLWLLPDDLSFRTIDPDKFLESKLFIEQINLATLLADERTSSEVRELKSNKINIATDVEYAFFCTLVRQGDSDKWKFVWNKYLISNSGWERSVLLKALGCSENRTLLSHYLDMLLDRELYIRKQDGNVVFSSVVQNEAGTEAALDFLINKWDLIQKHFGLAFNRVSQMVLSMMYLTSDNQVKRVERFFAALTEEGRLGTTEKAFNEVIELLYINLRLKSHSKDIANCLKELQNL